MPKLTITQGLPGSGKTTYARAWVAENPTGRARVNRDDLRALLHDSVWLGESTETLVVAVRDAAIRALLRRGVDVICDDTNLAPRAFHGLRQLARHERADFEVVDLTDVPLELCLERNAARIADGGLVPQEAILGMHDRYLARSRAAASSPG